MQNETDRKLRNDLTATEIERYAPYHTFPEFAEGYADYTAGLRGIGYDGVQGQAYDRGAECAMRHSMAKMRREGR
jgi:hypothetical protein